MKTTKDRLTLALDRTLRRGFLAASLLCSVVSVSLLCAHQLPAGVSLQMLGSVCCGLWMTFEKD